MPFSATVIVPTRNRPDAIAETLQPLLAACSDANFEVVVVDDGSTVPLSMEAPAVRVLRTPGVERSQARNLGAAAAQGELVIFLDDDITAPHGFCGFHTAAAREFGDVLCVGEVALPPSLGRTAFGRFRQGIEDPNQTRARGLVAAPDFCTAANMSMRRETFLALGGFDPTISSGEDQDLALRFSERGGRIVFLPEARVLHRDANANIESYCRRHEWGARAMAPLLRRYPNRESSKARLRFEKGFVARRVLSSPALLAPLLRAISIGEGAGIGDHLLFPMYSAALGLHLFRGFRKGLAKVKNAPPLPEAISSDSHQGRMQ